jgi:hypothetical protein
MNQLISVSTIAFGQRVAVSFDLGRIKLLRRGSPVRNGEDVLLPNVARRQLRNSQQCPVLD